MPWFTQWILSPCVLTAVNRPTAGVNVWLRRYLVVNKHWGVLNDAPNPYCFVQLTEWIPKIHWSLGVKFRQFSFLNLLKPASVSFSLAYSSKHHRSELFGNEEWVWTVQESVWPLQSKAIRLTAIESVWLSPSIPLTTAVEWNDRWVL